MDLDRPVAVGGKLRRDPSVLDLERDVRWRGEQRAVVRVVVNSPAVVAELTRQHRELVPYSLDTLDDVIL